SFFRSSRTQSMSSPRSATTISETHGDDTNLRIVCKRMGEPSSSINCLRLVPAFSGADRLIRVPKPAAGSITVTLIFTLLNLRLQYPSFALLRDEMGQGARGPEACAGLNETSHARCESGHQTSRRSSCRRWSAERWLQRCRWFAKSSFWRCRLLP